MPHTTAAVPSEPAPPFAHEAEYQEALRKLRASGGRLPALVLLAGSLLAFVLAARGGAATWLNVAILVGVLLLHEAGHWVGMRLLGWRDVRMFFIPFFGAAVSGRRAGAASWKEGVVLLLGPLPGIVAGTAIAAVVRTEGPPALRTAAVMLIAVNAFNLLPLAALDGGKLLQLAVFQRQRHLELAFLVVASVGLVAASVWLDARVIAYVAIATLTALPLRHRLLAAAQALRAGHVRVPGDPRELNGEAGRAVFLAARDALPGKRRTAAATARGMSAIVDLLSRTVPSRGHTAALLAAWAMGVGAAAGGIWLVRHPALRWRAVEDPRGRYTVELPGDPAVFLDRSGPRTPDAQKLLWERGDHAFWVFDAALPESAEDVDVWRRDSERIYTRAPGSRVERSGPKTLFGERGFEVVFARGRNRLVVRGFLRGGRRFFLAALAPATDERAADRFLDSFTLTGS